MDASSPLLRGYFGYEETIKGRSQLTVNEYFLDIRGFFRYYKQSHGLCGADIDLPDEFERDSGAKEPVFVRKNAGRTLSETEKLLRFIREKYGKGKKE